MSKESLQGVFAAALTPLDASGALQAEKYLEYLAFLEQRGCHGVLIMGTTGEGPSLSARERSELMRFTVQIRQQIPEFRLLAGTGTPSLSETVELTRLAFETGFDGVVVLPPYYFRNASEDGLFAWFKTLIEAAVPHRGSLFGYHIPAVSGVPLTIGLLERLRDAFGERFAGIKDSSGNPDHARLLGEHFGGEFKVFNGNDRLFTHALENRAAGCITAMASLASPDLRRVWDAHHAGESQAAAQERLNAARTEMEKYGPFPPFLKAVLARLYAYPRWYVRPPLVELSPADVESAARVFDTEWYA